MNYHDVIMCKHKSAFLDHHMNLSCAWYPRSALSCTILRIPGTITYACASLSAIQGRMSLPMKECDEIEFYSYWHDLDILSDPRSALWEGVSSQKNRLDLPSSVTLKSLSFLYFGPFTHSLVSVQSSLATSGIYLQPLWMLVIRS